MSQQWKVFTLRYYRNLKILRISRPVLLWCNFQSEHVAAGERVQPKILSEHLHFKLLKARFTFT